MHVLEQKVELFMKDRTYKWVLIETNKKHDEFMKFAQSFQILHEYLPAVGIVSTL